METSRKRAQAEEKCAPLSITQLMLQLRQLEVPHDHCESKAELRALLIAAEMDVDAARRRARSTAANKTPDEPLTARTYTFLAAALFVLYKVYSSNMLKPIWQLIAADTQPARRAPDGDYQAFETKNLFPPDEDEWAFEF